MRFPASTFGRLSTAGAVVLMAVTTATVPQYASGAQASQASQGTQASRKAQVSRTAQVNRTTQAAVRVHDPYSPANHHQYRRGVMPTVGRLREMRAWASEQPSVTAAGCCLTYHGGHDGAGVMVGDQRVYLVFYGSQWGSAGTDSGGDLTFSGDPSGEAPYAQALFKGLGMGSETWSGVMTQYCQGVAAGASSCPTSSTGHVGYPAGGALAGVWADKGVLSPSAATAHQLGAEAIRAAQHFGNLSAASNRNAQYLIMSPTGAMPDGFGSQQGFCSWHDYTGDSHLGLTSPYGPIAFVNLPYLTDAGGGCGENFVNSGSKGLLDGVSIVAGHEYAETSTDPYPLLGWHNSAGLEDADVCIWNSGAGDHSADLSLPTGTFAMQPTWANDGNSGAGSCELSHPVQTNGGIFNSGFETGTFFGWATNGTTAIVTTRPYAGKYAARAGASTPTDGYSRITQTFRAVGTHLSLWYDVGCPDTTSQSWTIVILADHTAGRRYTMLPRTCVRSSGWKELVATVIPGHSYTLTLTSHDDNDADGGDGAYAKLDRVRNY